MMPDLGKYAGPVLGAYAVGLLLLAIIIGVSLWKSRRMKRDLDAAEARRRHG